ncbi:unnamed protein product, partial [Discosporangium mesarthrocarpum]
RAELKERLQQVNVQLPAAEYDLRLQLSAEKKQPPPRGTVPDGWACKRTKRRSSWRSPLGVNEEQTWLWQVDLTVVEETRIGPTGLPVLSEVMELELEMVPAARDNWLKIEDR